VGSGTSGQAVQERKTIHIADLSRIDNQVFMQNDLVKKEGFVSYYAVPLVAKRKILGVLEIFHRTARQENSEWMDFLETLVGQVAIAIENAALVDDILRKHTELINAYNQTIEGWGTALSLKEEETAEHSQRVTEMTVRIAKAMGMKEEELYYVRLGALLHDIGKIGVPDSILLKPGKLTDDEW
jgi:HD-GYP domain